MQQIIKSLPCISLTRNLELFASEDFLALAKVLTDCCDETQGIQERGQEIGFLVFIVDPDPIGSVIKVLVLGRVC